MAAQADWFYELEAAGKGPDWIFNASFMPSSRALLGAAFRALAPRGFTLYHATQAPCPIHSRRCDYALYVDDHQYAALIAQLAGQQEQNVYVFHTMQACQGEVQIVRGYGGYPGQHGAEETRCIRALAQAPYSMLGWSIEYGGVTYPYEVWQRGVSAVGLLEYLDRPSR